MNPVNFPDYQSKSVAEFMAKAKQRTPNLPEIPSLEVRKLRALLILEEALETIRDGLGLQVNFVEDQGAPYQYFHYINMSHIDLSETHEGPSMIELADGCADLKVVTVGTELACGINGKPVFEEVMESNMTKFDGGSVRKDGKILKGPNYRPPNIERVLREQGWKP